MRALVLHGPGDLRPEEVPDPVPASGELVIAVEAAVTCATDAKMLRRGVHPALPAPPAPFGHEASGVVSAAGAGYRGPLREGDPVVVANSAPCDACRACRRGRPGLCLDLVYLSGAYAEYLRVPARIAERNTLERPAGMPPEIAALTEPVACAVRAVERSAARPGDSAVVLGGGIQGLTVAALLRRRGCSVVLCDPHAARRGLALRFGAVATAGAPRDEEARAAVLSSAGDGEGADVVFAAVGDAEAWGQAVGLARPGGEVNLHGGPDRDAMLAVRAAPLHYGEITLQASYHHTPRAVRAALALIRDGGLPFGELLGDWVDLDAVPAVLREGGAKRPVRPAAAGRPRDPAGSVVQ